MQQLHPDQRRALRAQAHGLNPVVSIAESGLTESVMKEIDVCLKAHELIKVRVYNDNREERESHLQAICEQLEAFPVQHIGKLLVIWRPCPEDDSAANKSGRSSRREPRRTKRSYQG